MLVIQLRLVDSAKDYKRPEELFHAAVVFMQNLRDGIKI